MDIQERLEKMIHGAPNSTNAYLREVCKNCHIGTTKTAMHIYMLRLDGNKRPRIRDFCEFLFDKIVDYCIPASEIRAAKKKNKKYNTTQYTTRLARKAKNLFTHISNSGEVGELALSVLTQEFLNMPQLLCKMSLKTNPNVHFHGADGLYGKYDNLNKKFLLYWGESKIYEDVQQALNNCFDSIKELLIEEGTMGTYRERDISLFRSNIDFEDAELQQVILKYLDPDNEEYNSLEYRGVCLVGYSETAYPKDFSAVEEKIFEIITTKINDFQSSIKKKISARPPLAQYTIEVILVPVSDANELRETFKKVLSEG